MANCFEKAKYNVMKNKTNIGDIKRLAEQKADEQYSRDTESWWGFYYGFTAGYKSQSEKTITKGYKNKSEFLKETNIENYNDYDIVSGYDLNRVGGIKIKCKIKSITKFTPKN